MSRRGHGRKGHKPSQNNPQHGGKDRGQNQSQNQHQNQNQKSSHIQQARNRSEGEGGGPQNAVGLERQSTVHQVKGGHAITSVMTPRRQIIRKQMHQRSGNPEEKTYGVIFFETLQAAKSDLAKLKEIAAQYNQLNIVIRAEASMDDPELNAIGKVFAGAAWALIHERRKQDGWYDSRHE